jgi:hypothetical protein
MDQTNNTHNTNNIEHKNFQPGSCMDADEALESYIDDCSQTSGKCMDEETIRNLLCSQDDVGIEGSGVTEEPHRTLKDTTSRPLPSTSRVNQQADGASGETDVEIGVVAEKPICAAADGPSSNHPPTKKAKRKRRRPGQQERKKRKRLKDSLAESSTVSVEPKRQRFDMADMEKSLPDTQPKSSTPKTEPTVADPGKAGEAKAVKISEEGVKPGPSNSGKGANKRSTGKGKTGPGSTVNTNAPVARQKYSDVAKSTLWRAIVVEGEENREFSVAQQEEISKELNLAIRRSAVSASSPLQMDGIDRTRGKFVVKCANEGTCLWLQSAVEGFKFNEGRLVCKSLQDLPKLIKCVTWIPIQDITGDEIIALLGAQNPSLDTKEWRVWSITKDGQGQLLTLGVNERCINALAGVNYQPHLLNGRVYMRIAGLSQLLKGGGRDIATAE